MSSPINISINLINQADISGLVNGSYLNVTGMACNNNGQIMYASVIGVGIIKSINSLKYNFAHSIAKSSSSAPM